MNFKFPVQKKELVDGKLVKSKGYEEFEIVTSLFSQMRFESKFPELAQQEDLYGYSDRIFKTKALSPAKILSELKLLYCWLATDIDFVDFVKLFDLTDIEYVKEFVNCLENAFKFILNSSSEKN